MKTTTRTARPGRLSRIARTATLFAAAIPLLGVGGVLGVGGADATVVRFDTNVGDIDVRLTPDVAPNTVANFLNYVTTDRYDGTFIHRVPQTVIQVENDEGQLVNVQVSSDFVVQGGGFVLNDSIFDAAGIVTDAPIGDEPNVSNQRGTIAMAKNSLGATSQWFFNLGDNAFLDSQGFTVFGEVINNGMAVVDAINALRTVDAAVAQNEPGEDYDEVPVLDFDRVIGQNDITNADAVIINTIDILIAGDFNGSGSVEQADLDLVLTNWGGARTFEDGVTTFASANVDQEELDIVLTQWGSSAAPSFEGSAVPEPATAALLGLGTLTMLRRRG